MSLPPLVRKMLAEFVGVAMFLTAIVGAGATFGSQEEANPFHAMVLAITLGLMALLVGGVSGGHLNPAVSLYFLSRKELSITEFIGYVVAQLGGAVAGVALADKDITTIDELFKNADSALYLAKEAGRNRVSN